MGAFVKPENLDYKTLDTGEDIQKRGFVVKLNTDGTVEPADAGDTAYGVALMTTENPFYGMPGENQYLTAVEIAVLHSGIVYLQLPAAHAAVAIGDKLRTANDGYVLKYTGVCHSATFPAAWDAGDAEAVIDDICDYIEDSKEIVGIALEAVALNTADEVLAFLTIGTR